MLVLSSSLLLPTVLPYLLAAARHSISVSVLSVESMLTGAAFGGPLSQAEHISMSGNELTFG